ncbi:energy-coupling factor transporter ATPase [Heliobacterium gestii]|uniref:ABC transporter ATP-binding protein n=1 Tax=Heliomicrobium gestii TaxID=2699 RepID=A0A845L932_HELGE|nr:energy-coupling factor transporter ATPase [Heliomicrobium gestii]MBM7865860.1 energy-coupling factor transport system ATP-binding protein [Heliomicrobium gestii]MZP42101.1 energy-coupling factor transporter ATPase [Heliomicrobium gestii]
MISIENVSFQYRNPDGDAIQALSNVSLTIRPGEWVAVLGANGSGKSTLAKHLNALLTPAGGRVRVNGLDTQDLRQCYDIRRQVGMVFQNPDNQLVATTVEEDVAFGPENLGLPSEEIRRRVDEALDVVGLQSLRERPPHDLSGGQKQRVAIAGALALRPEYLVFDEATSMLDPQSRREVLQTVRRLHKELAMTVITITHDMEEAAEAERVVVMAKGTVVFDGIPEALFCEEGLLEAAGLEPPPSVEIARRLRERGLNVPLDAVTMEKLVNALCR